MACGVYWQQVRTADSALAQLEKLGLGPGTEAYDAVYSKRGELLTQIGVKFPRIDYSLSMWEDFSPERLRTWFDPEFGFMVEGRTAPGAPPVYTMVTAEVVAAIIKREVTPDQIKALLTPDTYTGE